MELPSDSVGMVAHEHKPINDERTVMNILKKSILYPCIALANLAWVGDASAVGDGLDFHFDEDPIAGPNIVIADSLDLTYHACTIVVDGVMNEKGYYWNSSFQDETSVVDSQINHAWPNGYHLYAKYKYEAVQRGMPQRSITGNRLNYEILDGGIEMWVDPLSDTEFQVGPDCKVYVSNTDDDRFFGGSTTVAQGEKSEADGLAQGDFKIVFDNWMWGPAGNRLMKANEDDLYLEHFKYFVFNANITELNGALGNNHKPEGSGNVFWLKSFDRLPVGMDVR